MDQSDKRHDRQEQGDGQGAQQDVGLRESPARAAWPDRAEHMDVVHERSPSKGRAWMTHAPRIAPFTITSTGRCRLGGVERFASLEGNQCTCRAIPDAMNAKSRKGPY